MQPDKLVYYAEWDTRAHFYLEGSRDAAWSNWMRHHKISNPPKSDDQEDYDVAMLCSDNGKACAFWIRSRHLTPERIAAIAAEAYQAANRIIDRQGPAIVSPDNLKEPLAYLVQAIVRDLVTMIKTGK